MNELKSLYKENLPNLQEYDNFELQMTPAPPEKVGAIEPLQPIVTQLDMQR